MTLELAIVAGVLLLAAAASALCCLFDPIAGAKPEAAKPAPPPGAAVLPFTVPAGPRPRKGRPEYTKEDGVIVPKRWLPAPPMAPPGVLQALASVPWGPCPKCRVAMVPLGDIETTEAKMCVESARCPVCGLVVRRGFIAREK